MASLSDLTDGEKEALLTEIRDRWDYASEQWREIKEDGSKDMLCVAGRVWEAMDPKGLQQRKSTGRPFLSLDEIGQYVNQTVNDVRANPRAMKFSPTGNGANDKTAEFYGNKAREIEYRSHAQMVYTTAFENAVQRGYGFCRVTTKFAGPRTFNQDIWLEPIVNPDLVTPDPDGLKPDGSDMKYCFVHELWWVKDFQARFPNATTRDFGSDMQTSYPSWFKGDKIQIAEYWKVKSRKRTLLLFQGPAEGMPPIEIFKDELPEGFEEQFGVPDNQREVDDQSVCQYLTNGVEILEYTEWPGKYIPIAACYGKVLYLNEGAGTEKKLLSMVRLARDPYMLYCYYRTTQAELVGMTPKTPYMAYEGQLDKTQLLEIAKSLHEPVPVVLAKAQVEGTPVGTVLPLPQRQPYTPEIAALELGAEAARRAIQAAMGGTPLPTSAQRKNEKSGKALEQIEASGQRGNFHFIDHYEDMIRHVGAIVEDLMDKVLDTARDVAVLEKDDAPKTVRINDPANPDAYPTKGDHLVTISTGPAFESEREAASDFADTLANIPAVFAQCADLIIRLKNLGPIGDALAERLTPPEYRQQSKDGKMDPQAMLRENAELKKTLEALQQAAAAMKDALETEQAKQQAGIEKAQIDTKRALLVERMRGATQIAIAKVQAASKLEAEDAKAAADAALAELENTHESIENELQREHEKELADLKANQALMLQEAKPEPKQEGAGA